MPFGEVRHCVHDTLGKSSKAKVTLAKCRRVSLPFKRALDETHTADDHTAILRLASSAFY